MILKAEGVVLKTFNFRETSRIATFFTPAQGKIKGVLKGIRKDHKKFGTNLDRFSVNDIVYYQYRRSDLHLISHCDLKNYFFPIRQDLKKSLAACYILDLVDAIMPPEEPNKDVYQLMIDCLTSLQIAMDISKLIHIFQIKILLFSGFRPFLDSCLKCGRKIKTRAIFSPQLGGLACLTCKHDDPQKSIISQGTVATILHMEKHAWDECLRIGLTNPTKKELKLILNNFLVYHLEKHLKTARFLP